MNIYYWLINNVKEISEFCLENGIVSSTQYVLKCVSKKQTSKIAKIKIVST